MSETRVTVRPERTARVEVLFRGYAGSGVASTVSLVRDRRVRAIVDPGMVPTQKSILAPLHRLGVRPDEVTDVVLSHHHPDHTMNVALFPKATVHDFWASYRGDRWHSRPAEGFCLTPSVVLLETPGHTPQDVTTLVGTPTGVVALTHLWWNARGPTPDPLASDERQLERERRRVLELADQVIPGHGAPFTVRRARRR